MKNHFMRNKTSREIRNAPGKVTAVSWINCGARIGTERVRTKTGLRAALAVQPENVTFDTTQSRGPRAGDTIHADVDDIGSYRLSVVGPDPYTDRRWYAVVQITKGKIKVS